MKKTSKKAATEKRTFTKVCMDCGKVYKTVREHSQFCDACRRHRAVLATLRNRERKQAAEAEMKRLGKTGDNYSELHLKVGRAVTMMTAGHAVVCGIRDWLLSVSVPESMKNTQWNRLQTMLNCYAMAEKGAR